MEKKKIVIVANETEKSPIKRHVTQRYDMATLRKLQDMETWIEESLETLYNGTGRAAPEFDFTSGASLGENELKRYLEKTLLGSVDAEKKKTFIAEYICRSKDIF